MAAKAKKQPEKRGDSSGSEMMQRIKSRPFIFIGTIIILVIVVIAFVFVPAIVPHAQGMEDHVFGYYNKTPIRYVPGNYFYRVQRNLMDNQRPSQEDPNFFNVIEQIWGRAFAEMVVHMGMLDEMKQAGFVIPENVVDREVAKQFQEDGRFAAARYRTLDSSERMALWRQARDSLAAEYYVSDYFNLKTSPNEASFIASIASLQRSFDLAIFPLASYPDSEIISFAQANPALFRIIRLSRITIHSGSEREARQILDSIRNGISTFEEAALSNSQDEYAERGGDMGIRMAFELLPEIGDEQARESIINLSRGEISDLVRVSPNWSDLQSTDLRSTDLRSTDQRSEGWAFFRAEEAARPADLNDPTQMEKIRNYIMFNLRGLAEDWLIAEAEKFSAQVREIGFYNAVSYGNIISRNFGPIPVNYGDSTIFSSVATAGVPELRNAGTDPFFWRAAFSTPLNTPSVPFVFEGNVMVLYPQEELFMDENDLWYVETYYPYIKNENMETALRIYFLTNEKFENRFEDTFSSLWR